MRRVRLMAAQASGVLLGRRGERFGTEVVHARQWAAARRDVRAARAVTGLALQSAMTEGAVRIVRARMLGAENARDVGVAAMTTEAGVGSLRAVGGRRRGGANEPDGGASAAMPAPSGRLAPPRPTRRNHCNQRHRMPVHRTVSGSSRRGGAVWLAGKLAMVHDLHVRDPARTMAYGTGLEGRDGAGIERAVCVLLGTEAASVLQHVVDGRMSVWQAEHAAEFGVATVAWVRSRWRCWRGWWCLHGRGIHRVLRAGKVAGLAVGEAGAASAVLAGYSTWNVSPPPGRGWSRS